MKKGFTLIELLVVISIVGILATLAILGLNSVRSKGRDAKRVSDIRQIQSALEMYKIDNNVYPNSLTSGSPLVGSVSGLTYLAKVPAPPGVNDGTCSSDTYTYESLTPSTSYSIAYCLGSAVQAAGPDDCVASPGNLCATPPAAPPAAVCGNGILEGAEVCDSDLTTLQCPANTTYYRGGYVADGITCDVQVACNNTCTSCIATLPCIGI